jgi:hypothetical protein
MIRGEQVLKSQEVRHLANYLEGGFRMKHRYLCAPLALTLALAGPLGAVTYATRPVSLPADTVLKVRLNDTVSSETSRTGDRFMATVDDNTLPQGTRVEGVVIGVTKADKDRPGKLGLDFRTLQLPSGRRIVIAGSPTGLDAKSVKTTSSGRLVATSHSKNNTGKYVAYGAAGGLLIGSLLGKNVVGGLLGAGAGYLLGKNKDKKAEHRDVVLKEGQKLGVRLDRGVVMQTAWLR